MLLNASLTLMAYISVDISFISYFKIVSYLTEKLCFLLNSIPNIHFPTKLELQCPSMARKTTELVSSSI